MTRRAPLVAWLALAGAACASAESSRPVVLVSVLPQARFVERLAGELVEIVVMIPPGANEALHEPTIAQMRAVARARLYVKVGHPSFAFERAWLDRLLADNRSLRVVDSSAGLDHRAGDPHVWASPGPARVMVENIGAALRELLPGHRERISREQAAFLKEIDALDAEIRGILQHVRGKSFVVFHPAWGYFAAEYGLEQVAIEDDGKEPGPLRLRRLVEWARSSGIRTVLAQPQFSRTGAELLAREIGATVVTVDPLTRDWEEGLRELARAIAGEGI